MSAPPIDVDTRIREMIRGFSVSGDDASFTGGAPSWFGPRLFGGFSLGQVLGAASHTVADGRRVHSLHAYFLRPALAGRRCDTTSEV